MSYVCTLSGDPHDGAYHCEICDCGAAERKRMRATLINFTGYGMPDPARHAANVLLFTKNTRLQMTPGVFEEIAGRDDATVLQELHYMSRTIPSSWEFVEYTFLLNDVTRAFTHQLVRTRTGSYAQQSLRVLKKKDFDVLAGPSIEEDEGRLRLYNTAVDGLEGVYSALIDEGAAIEDARGIIPTNILTNIVAKFSLRTMTELARKRASSRTQGEYRDVLAAMKKECIRVHPFTEMFFNRTFDTAAAELEKHIRGLPVPPERRTDMIKLIDQMRQD